MDSEKTYVLVSKLDTIRVILSFRYTNKFKIYKKVLKIFF